MSIKISFTVRNKTHVSEKNTTTNEKAPGRMKRKDYVIWFVRWFFSHTFTLCIYISSFFSFSTPWIVFASFRFELCIRRYFEKCFHCERFPLDLSVLSKTLIKRHSLPNGSSLNWLNERNTVITVAHKATKRGTRSTDTSQYALWKATHFNSHYSLIQNCLNGNLHSNVSFRRTISHDSINRIKLCNLNAWCTCSLFKSLFKVENSIIFSWISIRTYWLYTEKIANQWEIYKSI